MKKHLLIFAVALLLSACGGNKSGVSAPVENANAPSPAQNSGYKNVAAPPPIPFTGDACEYAKQSFIRAYQEYQQHLGDPVLHEKQQQARLAVQAVCEAEKEDEPKTWACAEGHSCR